jgi:uncharacterized protein (DUF1800 family)
VQLSSSITNTTDTAVLWQVNGISGGSAVVGSISASGLYTPPTIMPQADSVVITATIEAAPSATTNLTETLLNPIPVVQSAIATVTTSNITLEITGTGFVALSSLILNNSSISANLVSPTELVASLPLGAQTGTMTVIVANPAPGGTLSAPAQVTIFSATVASAGRILDQTSFGPTAASIQHVVTVGLDAYLAEQFAATPTTLADLPATLPAVCSANAAVCLQSEWWKAALTSNDQLRQRVALALSEIFVVSSFGANPRSIPTFHNILVNDAFADFSTLLRDITLSPAMGAYLNMLNSEKPGYDQIANQNYARESMQLFTTGLYLLNPDGTPQLNAQGNEIAVYSEAQVDAFARAYTGWTYATADGGSPATFFNNIANYDAPMASVETAHETSAKTLLSGTVLPAGQSAEQDLAGALANIFAHPNVGPFICRQLIQHLVTSSPGSAYVSRVAGVFANDGSGVRGDMKAVITAILKDPEARQADTDSSFDAGRLREPLLYITGIMRGLTVVNDNPNGDYSSASTYTTPLGEAPYAASSVFSFFPPGYIIPGTTLNAPEFALENTGTIPLRLALAEKLVFNALSGFSVDLSSTSALGVLASSTGNPTTDSGNLVDALGNVFLHGQMPATMRTTLITHLATLTDIPQRTRVATYLVITSPQYLVQH